MNFATRFYVTLLIFALSLAGEPRLRQLLEVCRHGARDPIEAQFPSLFPLGDGELTPQGSRMHYLIGNQLRKEYIENLQFLDETYNVNQIYVRSTPVNRTIMSARSQLFGLYPPGAGQTLTEEQQNLAVPPISIPDIDTIKTELGEKALQGQINDIPIEVKDGIRDLILRGYQQYDCPRSYQLQLDGQKTDQYISGLNTFVDAGFMETINRVFNRKDLNITADQIWSLADDIIATSYEYPDQNIYNVTLSELLVVKQYHYYVFYKGMYGNKEAVQLSQTALFQDILQRFKDCINNDATIAALEKNCTTQATQCQKARGAEQNRLKFTYFSAHDTNIAGMATFLDVPQHGLPPPFASTFFFRLLSKDQILTGNPNDYLIEVVFNGAVIYTFDTYGHFEGFINSRAFNGNLEEACQNMSKSKGGVSLFVQIGVPIIAGVIVIAIVMLTIYCCCCRKKKNQENLADGRSSRPSERENLVANKSVFSEKIDGSSDKTSDNRVNRSAF